MKEKPEGIVAELQAFAKRSNSYYKEMNARIVSDLAYVGGEMFDDKDRKNFGKNRPEMPIMLLNNYCNQIKNQYSQKPFGMELSAKTIKAKQSVDKVKGILRGIEAASNAKASYTVAIDRQTKAGRGYVAITTDWASDGGFEQEIKIEPIHNPEMVIWSTMSKQIAGADCDECALVEHISCSKAESMFGEEEDWDDMANPLEDTQWDAPEESVSLITYYKLKKTKSVIYQGEDGAVTSKGTSKQKSRTTTTTSCMVYKIIGDKVVGETELPIKFIPIVPFLGQLVDRKKKLDWVGLVFFGKTPCKMINWAASEAASRLAKAPKSLLVADATSIAPYKREWDLYGVQDLALGRYDSRDANDPTITYNAPELRNASVDITDMSSTMANYQQILAAVLGMSQAGSEQQGAGNETAASVLTRQKTMDVSNFTTLDNASESIKQVCRIILSLIPVIYDTTRLVPVVDSKTGEVNNEELNVADLGIIADEYNVEVSSGPMASTLQNEKLSKIIAIMGVMGPEAAVKYEKYLVEASDALDVTAMESLFGEAGGETDPEAIAALDQADQHIASLTEQTQQLQLYVTQLQSELQSQRAIAQSSIVVEQIRSKNKLDVESMKLQGKMTSDQMKIIADADQAEKDSLVELEKMRMEIANRPVTMTTAPTYQAVGGLRNDIYG